MFLSIKWVNHLIKATGTNGKHLVGRITHSPKNIEASNDPIVESPFSWSFTTSSQHSLSVAKVIDNSIANGQLNTTVTKQNDSQSNSTTSVYNNISNETN
jgi:hypothetical protein